MANFIRVTNRMGGDIIRVNIDHIISYSPNGAGADLKMIDDHDSMMIIETCEELDQLLGGATGIER